MKNINYLFFISLFCPYLIFANKYFIDPNKGSIKNNGSYINPWSTLEEVVNKKKILDGDTLILLSGYHGKKIILRDRHKSKVVVMGLKNSEPKISQMIVKGEGWELQNLIFSNEFELLSDNKGLYDNGTFLIFESSSRKNKVISSKFYSTQNSNKWNRNDWRKKVWSGIKDYGIYNIIENNYLINIAFAIESSFPGSHSLIKNNHIENFSGDGIRIGGSNHTIVEYNNIINSIELDKDSLAGNHEDGIQAWVVKPQDTLRGIIIRGNYIQNYAFPTHPFSGILQGISFFDGFYKKCIIENNIVIVEHAHGISIYGANECIVVNNTVLPYPNTFPYKLGPPWLMINAHKDGRKSKNNIVANNLTTSISIQEGSTVLLNNLIECCAFKYVNNYENFDFSPKPNFRYHDKKIIDAGNNKYAPKIDFLKNKRPSRNGTDIGAIELK